MKNRYTIEKIPLLERALEFFLAHSSQEVYLREYGRILKISPNSAQRFLNQFVAQGLLVEQRKGHLRFFKANLESIVFRQAKILSSMRELQRSRIIELLKEQNVSHMVLFGSLAEGKDDENSDIDLAIITSNKEHVKQSLSLAQKRLNRELSAHIFSWNEWKEQEKKNPAFYRDVLIKGISLIGQKPLVS